MDENEHWIKCGTETAPFRALRQPELATGNWRASLAEVRAARGRRQALAHTMSLPD